MVFFCPLGKGNSKTANFRCHRLFLASFRSACLNSSWLYCVVLSVEFKLQIPEGSNKVFAQTFILKYQTRQRRCRSFFFKHCSLNPVLDSPVGNSVPPPKILCTFGLTLPSYQIYTSSDPSASQRSLLKCHCHSAGLTLRNVLLAAQSTKKQGGFGQQLIHLLPHLTDTQQNHHRSVCKGYAKIPLPLMERESMKQLYLQFRTMSRRGKDRGKKSQLFNCT